MVSGISLNMSNEGEIEQYRTWTVGSHMTVFSVNSSSKKSHNICNIGLQVHPSKQSETNLRHDIEKYVG
jgi:hypothetical protein